MATTRTVITPDGDVITVDVADQTVMTPDGAVINANIEAAAGGGFQAAWAKGSNVIINQNSGKQVSQ